MTKSEIKEKKEKLLTEVINKVSLERSECVRIALFIVGKILNECPSRVYWDTYDDETPSAITVWKEVKEELNEELKTLEIDI